MEKQTDNTADVCFSGLTKNDVKQILGSEFNFFLSHFWIYDLKAEWWETSRHLYLIFEDGIIGTAYIRIFYFGGLYGSGKKMVKSIERNAFLNISDEESGNFC